MPLESCGDNKWRWGQSGKCYTSKKDAIRQGLAIEGPDKFKKIMKSEGSPSDWKYVKAALAEYEKEQRVKKTSAFRSIASFLSAKADGENSTNVDRGDILDENSKGGTKEVDNAGDFSGNPQNSGNGSGNEFTSPKGKKGEASLTWKVDTGEKPSGDFTSHPGTETVDDPQKPPASASLRDGKPTETKVGTDDPANTDSSLDKSRDHVGSTGVVPPVNKSASPETQKKNYVADYPVYNHNDTGPHGSDNRQTLDSKVQYEVKNPRSGKADKTITNIPEGEDIVRKTEAREIEAFFTNAYISQEERDGVAEEDFAGPHRSFPIRNSHDVQSASKLVGHGANPTSIKRKIIQIAKRKGLDHALPDSWKGADQQSVASVYEQTLALFNKLNTEEKKALQAKLSPEFEEQAVNKP